MIEWTVDSPTPRRLDQLILARYPGLGLGRLNQALRRNKIKLNGKKQPLSARAAAGDVIRLYFDPDEAAAARPACPAPEIVYQDEDVLILNKPAGLPVDAPEGDSLRARAQEICQSARLCHRLDTGTSGLVLLAKHDAAERQLTEAFRERTIDKTYLCVTFGRPAPPAATLEGWLEKDAARGMVYVHPQRRGPADRRIVTRYRTIAVSGRLALLQVQLVTGRTHQIRAHLAGIGCPILGDGKYGRNAVNRELKLKYQLLCAWELRFPPEFPMERLAGRTFHAARPWYYGQMLRGELK